MYTKIAFLLVVLATFNYCFIYGMINHIPYLTEKDYEKVFKKNIPWLIFNERGQEARNLLQKDKNTTNKLYKRIKQDPFTGEYVHNENEALTPHHAAAIKNDLETIKITALAATPENHLQALRFAVRHISLDTATYLIQECKVPIYDERQTNSLFARHLSSFLFNSCERKKNKIFFRTLLMVGQKTLLPSEFKKFVHAAQDLNGAIIKIDQNIYEYLAIWPIRSIKSKAYISGDHPILINKVFFLFKKLVYYRVPYKDTTNIFTQKDHCLLI